MNGLNFEIIKKTCNECKNMRKFLKGTERDIKNICGNCWDWEKNPPKMQLTDEEIEKLREILKNS